jgi:hypothetical protein
MADMDQEEYRARRQQYKQMAREASRPETAPEELSRLSKMALADMLRYGEQLVLPVAEMLAAHPNTPPDLLRGWLYSAPDAFLRNPVLPLLLLESPTFFDEVPEEMLLPLLARAAMPSPAARVLAESPHETIAQAARMHVAVAGEAGDDWEAEVVWHLKRQPIEDEDAYYEFALLGLFPDWLTERTLRWRGDWRGDRPPRGVRALTPPPPLSRYVLPETPPQPPEGGWETLLQQSEAQRIQRAGDPALPPEALLLLATDRRKAVRIAVAKNPAATAEVLTRLAERQDEDVWCHIAVHPNATTDTLLRAFATDAWWSHKVAWSLLQRPEAPRRVLTALAKHPNVAVRLALYHRYVADAEEPDAPSVVGLREIQRLAALSRAEDHSDPVLVYFALAHRNPPAHRFNEIAASNHWLHRLAIARHPKTPRKVRQRLAEQDGNRFVRAAARTNNVGR